ncbi:MAG: iron complex transport system permease protein [Cyclobacteriaceae bacterium]
MLKKHIILLSVLLALVFLMNLSIGSVGIPVFDVFEIIIGKNNDNFVWENIILNFRLPRAITAILAGMGLSLSGLFMQTYFRNPLAGPFVLGISSGASLGVAIVVLGSSWLMAVFPFIDPGNWGIISGSVIGASLVFSVVLLFAKKVNNNTSLLIIGLMFSSATSAIVSILQYFSSPENIQSYIIWTFGDLGGVTNGELSILAPIVIVALLLTIFMIKPLNILQLGEMYAKNAGLNIKSTRYGIVFITALLAGSITAFCGPIAFIGLAVPHIARMITNSTDHNKILPVTAFTGAIILLVCDIVSRLPGFTQTLPLNAVTSLFGGPLVIWLIIKKKNLYSSF